MSLWVLDARTGVAVAVVQADARDTDAIVAGSGLLDLTRPVALLLLGVLHVVPDEDDPPGIVARLRDADAAIDISPAGQGAMVTTEPLPNTLIVA